MSKNYTIHVDNLDDREGLVMLEVTGPGALAWAREDQTVDGSRWEGVDDAADYAYALVMDRTTLVTDLQSQGYVLNLDDYSPPTEP